MPSQINNLSLICTLMQQLVHGGLKALITSVSIRLLFSFLKDHYAFKTNFILQEVRNKLSPLVLGKLKNKDLVICKNSVEKPQTAAESALFPLLVVYF